MTAEQPNQGATGDVPDTSTSEPTGDPGPAGAGAPVNQGAPGSGPSAGGQSPLSAQGGSNEFLDEHPEALVGAAFVGGVVLAQILKQFGE